MYRGGLSQKQKGIAVAAVIVAIIVIGLLVYFLWYKKSDKSSFTVAGTGYSRFSPAPQYTNAFRGGMRTDPTGSEDRWYNAGPDSMNEQVLKGIFSRGNTDPVFNVGGSKCSVSPTNNCPAYVNYACDDKQWNSDATGELLALTATGSFAAPSLANEPNLERLVEYSYDTVDRACADANVRALYNKNMNAAAVSTDKAAFSPYSSFGLS